MWRDVEGIPGRLPSPKKHVTTGPWATIAGAYLLSRSHWRSLRTGVKGEALR